MIVLIKTVDVSFCKDPRKKGKGKSLCIFCRLHAPADCVAGEIKYVIKSINKSSN